MTLADGARTETDLVVGLVAAYSHLKTANSDLDELSSSDDDPTRAKPDLVDLVVPIRSLVRGNFTFGDHFTVVHRSFSLGKKHLYCSNKKG